MKKENRVAKDVARLIKRRSPAILNFPTKIGEEVEFPQGLVGFEQIHRYRFRMEDQYRPFLFMDAIDNDEVSFICVDTFFVCPEYEANIPHEVAARLSSIEHTAVFSIVTIRQDQDNITANLMSPLIIDLETQIGEQVILENSGYPVQYSIRDTLPSEGQEEAQAK